MSVFADWFVRLKFNLNTVFIKLFWKIRLVFRAIYASTTKSAARNLSHQLTEANKLSRNLRSENTRLLKVIQNQNNDGSQENNSEASQFQVKYNILKRRNLKLSNTIEQLMAETNGASSEASLRGNLATKFYKHRYTKLLKSLKSQGAEGDNSQNNNQRRVEFIKSFGAAPVYLALDNVLFANAYKVCLSAKFTHVICHDVLGLGAAVAMADAFDAELWVDLVEDIRLEERTGDHYVNTMHDEDIALLNSYTKAHINSAITLLSIGPSQKEYLGNTLGKESLFLPNYRDPYVPSEQSITQARGLLSEHSVSSQYICLPNRIRSLDEIKPFLDALYDIKSECDIVQVGPELPETLTFDIQSYLKDKPIRFVQLGMRDYDVYRQILSGALYSLLSNTRETHNARQAYPNRLFDCVSSVCPILTSGFTQVSDFVNSHDIGISIEDGAQQALWNAKVYEMEKKRSDFIVNLADLKKKLTWSKQASSVFNSIPENSEVLIISRKHLQNNIRIQNMKRSLELRKCRVKVIGGDRKLYQNNNDYVTVPLMRKLTSDDFIQPSSSLPVANKN